MGVVIGEKQHSIQVQFKTKGKSLSFTVKNVKLEDAYSRALFLFKRLAENEDNNVTLTMYDTKRRKALQ